MEMAKIRDKNEHQNDPIIDPSLVRSDPPDPIIESGKTTTTHTNKVIYGDSTLPRKM